MGDSMQYHDVIIVGTGFAGIGIAAQLRRDGFSDLLILERSQDVGGTWRDNRYPGAACDVPSHLYSFSFRPNPDWTRTFSPQEEILDYLRETAREEGLIPLIRFGAELLEAAWDESAQTWTVKTSAGVFTSRILITATGHLSDVKLPDIAGLSSFGGDMFHSAEWDDSAEFEGKRIGVIGSGASGIQIVPELAKVAGELVVFQRSAPYITPRHDRAYSEIEKRTFARFPDTIQRMRSEFFWANEARFVERQAVPAMLEQAARGALDHLAAQVPDLELRRRLTPDYQIGCKRILKSNDYYPALMRSNVALETTGIERVDAQGVVLADGRLRELDVLVMATGFEATDLPVAYRIAGERGQLLSDRWSTGMQAYATTSVHGFPNLFVMNGPNSGLGHNSVVYIIEAQISYILGALRYMRESGTHVLAVTEQAEEDYIADLESRSVNTVWLTGGCQNWYVDPRNGRLTTLWPDFAHTFRDENAVFAPDAYEQPLEVGAVEVASC